MELNPHCISLCSIFGQWFLVKRPTFMGLNHHLRFLTLSLSLHPHYCILWFLSLENWWIYSFVFLDYWWWNHDWRILWNPEFSESSRCHSTYANITVFWLFLTNSSVDLVFLFFENGIVKRIWILLNHNICYWRWLINIPLLKIIFLSWVQDLSYIQINVFYSFFKIFSVQIPELKQVFIEFSLKFEILVSVRKERERKTKRRQWRSSLSWWFWSVSLNKSDLSNGQRLCVRTAVRQHSCIPKVRGISRLRTKSINFD